MRPLSFPPAPPLRSRPIDDAAVAGLAGPARGLALLLAAALPCLIHAVKTAAL